MTREEATAAVREAKLSSGLTWRELAQRVGRSPVWTTAALLGQAAIAPEEARADCEALGLGDDVSRALVHPRRRAR